MLMSMSAIATRRAQILLPPEEYDRLAEIATHLGVSVAELFRRAVREKYLTAPGDRRRVVREIAEMSVPIPYEWETIEEEIEDARAPDLP